MPGILGARIYTSPADAPIADGAVVMSGGVIRAVGQRGRVSVPAGAATVDGTGLTVTAGFWNTHVHFTEAQWPSADSRPAAELAAGLRAMLTRWGVVRAVDTGSRPANTFALRRRIESGEIPGSHIMIAGGGFVPAGGSPYYLLPARLLELPDAARAAAFVDAGGQLLFDTDVAYMTDFDPTDEYLLLQRAGLSFPAILAMLTTAPAARFGVPAGSTATPRRHPGPGARSVYHPPRTRHLRAHALSTAGRTFALLTCVSARKTAKG